LVTKSKSTAGKAGVKKLKLKKETIRDLDAKGKATQVKGGTLLVSVYCRAASMACATAACGGGTKGPGPGSALFCRG
jgi:hypothetical protein